MKMEIWMSRFTATIFQFCFVYSLQYLTHDLTSSSKLIQMLAESLAGKKMYLKTHKSKENGMVIIGGGVDWGRLSSEEEKFQSDKFKSYIEQDSEQ